MIDWNRIEGFGWDNGNSRKNADKHEVSQPEAEQVFINEPLLIDRDDDHSGDEPRFRAYGQTVAGRRLTISFTLRAAGTLVRVISARPMSRRERERYEQET